VYITCVEITPLEHTSFCRFQIKRCSALTCLLLHGTVYMSMRCVCCRTSINTCLLIWFVVEKRADISGNAIIGLELHRRIDYMRGWTGCCALLHAKLGVLTLWIVVYTVLYALLVSRSALSRPTASVCAGRVRTDRRMMY
jgi:hypothetical protein